MFVGIRGAWALPWDRDMFRQPSYKPNELTRSPAEGTVPLGYEPFRMSTEDAEKKLSNPVEVDRNSVWRGRRIWSSNCRTCHGLSAKSDGPVGPLMGAPDLTTDLYKGKSDGRFFGVIMNGGTNMPRYGYKFSEHEIWDVINYLRFLQRGKDVAGFERPQ